MIDPEITTGFIHAKWLTRESADTVGQALEFKRVNHVLTSDKALVLSEQTIFYSLVRFQGGI